MKEKSANTFEWQKLVVAFVDGSDFGEDFEVEALSDLVDMI